MADTTFVDGQTVIEAAWLNDVNEAIYNPLAAVIPASSLVNTPAGNIAATDVQTALNELDTEKQPLDNELTALATSTAAANKIPYFTSGTTAGTLDWNAASTLANSATTISSNTVIKAAVDAMDIDTQVAPGTSGNLLTSNGSAWASVADKAIGVSQTWQDVKTTPGRVLGTLYTNSTGKPIAVNFSITAGGGSASIPTLTIDSVVLEGPYTPTTNTSSVFGIVPNGSTYTANGSGTPSLRTWVELTS